MKLFDCPNNYLFARKNVIIASISFRNSINYKLVLTYYLSLVLFSRYFIHSSYE
jgi:hypothetical protein